MPADEDPWLRRFHRADHASARLLCFPYAGGSASFFLPFSALHGDGVDVVAVQYPGRQDRSAEPPIGDVGTLADHVYQALIREAPGDQPEVPLTLFGHSMGTLVAFEVARRLESSDRLEKSGPARIFASGRRAPSIERDERTHLADDDGIVAEVRRMDGTPEAILRNPGFMRAALPALRADYRAAETYRCPPGATVRCPISVLTGEGDPTTSVAEASAWARHTTGQFSARVFTGGHFFLADHADAVTGLLREHFAVGSPA
jgi:surfactin synthase thioesterase subunit